MAAGGPPTASPRGAKEPRAGCAGKAPAARRGGTAARRGVGGTKAYDTPRARRSTPRRAAGDATRGCARVRGCAAAQGLTTARRAQRGNAQWAQGAAYTPRAPRCATPRRRRSDHDNTTHRSAYVHAWRGLRRGQPVLRRPAGPQGGASQGVTLLSGKYTRAPSDRPLRDRTFAAVSVSIRPLAAEIYGFKVEGVGG